jgi:hypothetical protein
MSFADKGAVADIEPAFFIGYLHRLKATGTLKFEEAPIQRAIYFREGRVLFSSSNAPEDQLGAILIAGGKISQEQFDGLLAGLEPKQSIAAALAQGGHVSQRDIGDAARRKVEQIVGSCCVQTSGRYEFEDGVLPKGALDLKLTTEKVLVSGFDVLEPSGYLNRILKSPMAVLAQTEVIPTEPDLVRLREALDGTSSLADIAASVGLSLPATEVRAAVLVVLGAASVVTSQIEEMSLPDTGEDLALPQMDLSEESAAFDAGSASFEETSPDLGSAGADSDSTLVMGGSGEAPYAPPEAPVESSSGSSDATMVVGSGLDLLPPPPPRTPRTQPPGATRAGAGKREKATTGDLNAVKELINAAPVRPASSTNPPKRWEPQLSSAGRSGRADAGLMGFLRRPIVRQVAGGVLLVGALVFGWTAYNASQTPRHVVAPVPSATPVAAAPASVSPSPFAPPSAAQTSPAGAPAGATPGPAVVGPTATPPPVAAPSTSPTPVPKATPKPPVTPTPTPVPAATTAPTVRAAPAPAAAASTGLAPAPGAAYEALKAGRLAEAAASFDELARSRRAEFSIQLFVACAAQSVEKAVLNDPSPELFILPTSVGGKVCHRVMRGFYKTNAAAAAAVSSVPSYYGAEGAKPRAIALKAVVQ